MTRPSLQLRLVVPLVGLWLGSAVLAALASYGLTGRAVDVALDRILADDARALATQVRWTGEEPSFALDANTAASLVYDSLAPQRFAVWSSGGRVLVGDARLQPPAASPRPDGPVFTDLQLPRAVLRVVALHVASPSGQAPVWVLVAEDEAKRIHLRSDLARAIFLPAMLAGFVILPLVVMGVRYALRWARRTSDDVAARSLSDLSPLPLDRQPLLPLLPAAGGPHQRPAGAAQGHAGARKAVHR